MADYEEVAGEADEEDTPVPEMTPRQKLYATVQAYKQQEFQGLKDFAAALGSEQAQSLGEEPVLPSYPEVEALPGYIARVKKLLAKKKELDRRRDNVLRKCSELFPS